MKLIWISDPHLEFLSPQSVDQFIEVLNSKQGDALLITGDISNANRGPGQWAQLLKYEKPIYFVLGNHDYYSGSIVHVQSQIKELVTANSNLHWIHGKSFQLSPSTWLVGTDGWGDGRAGMGSRSQIRLNDSNLISELRGLDTQELFAKLAALGDESVEALKIALLPVLAAKPKSILVATHVPPFVEASLYNNKPSEGNFAPHFVNLCLGKYLTEIATTHPEISFRVLCGHTHHIAHYVPLPNLSVDVAGAEYNSPEVKEIISIE